MTDINNVIWLIIGFTSWIQLERIFSNEFGKISPEMSIIPMLFFTYCGILTCYITIFAHLVFELKFSTYEPKVTSK